MLAAELFRQIQNNLEPSSDNRYRVVSLPDMFHKLSCSEEGYPKFFVETSDHSAMMHNLNAEMLTVEYDMPCNIIEVNQVVDNLRYTIITLQSPEETLQKMFLDVFLMMLRSLPPKPSNPLIASKIENLLSIFAKLRKKPIHKLQGLWAELLVIEQSKDPTTTARAWHSLPESKYDFTMGRDKIEVKSTMNEQRIHRFSNAQLNPLGDSRLLVASVIVRESAKDQNGLSVFDLYDSIALKINSDSVRMHVYEVIADTLGNEYNNGRKKYFDYSEACDSLAFFEHTDVPKIPSDSIPELVTEVKFSSNLSHLSDIRTKGYDRGDSTLYNALY